MLPNLTGQVIGKYRLEERLGQGENAVAYKAIQSGLDRPVTLKILSVASRDAQARLRRESVTLAQFRHPGIRQIYSIETFGEFFFAVLEYADGSLRGLMSSRFEQGRVFARAEAVRYLRPVADVLGYLHGRGWVHLDVKPENIMLVDGQRIALADFGIAQPFGKAQYPGTPGYAPPEMLAGGSVGPPADVFALAAVAYEMVAGQPPFRGTLIERISATRLAVPPRVDQVNPCCSNSLGFVLKSALARDMRERSPRSAGTLLDRLDRADTMTVRLPTLPRRRPALVLGAGALLFLASGLGFWRPWSSFTAPRGFLPIPVSTVVAGRTEDRPGQVDALPSPSSTRPVPTLTLAPTMTLMPTTSRVATSAPSPRPPAGMACTNAERVDGASIVEPGANARLKRGPIPIRGTADLQGMTEYEFYVHDSSMPPDTFAWRDSRPAAVRDGLLWTWATGDLAAGSYTLRLRVKLNSGQYKECDVPVTLD